MIYRISNKYARRYVEERKVFRGSNIFSEFKSCFYVVYSYGHHFPMYVYNINTRIWYENKDKYSCSTSRHQSQCRPSFNTIKVTTSELGSIIRG